MQTKTKSTKSALQNPTESNTDLMFGQVDYIDAQTLVDNYLPATELINNAKWVNDYPRLNLYIRKSTFTVDDYSEMDMNKIDIESDDGKTSTIGDKNSEVCKFVLSFLNDKKITVNDPITYFEYDGKNWIINGNTRYEMINFYTTKGKNLGVTINPIPVRRLEDSYVNPETLLSFQVQSNDVTRHQSMRAVAGAIRAYYDSLVAENEAKTGKEKLTETDIRKQTIKVFQHTLGTGNNANNKLSARLKLTELPEFIQDLIENGQLADTTGIKLVQKHETLLNDFEKAGKNPQGHTIEVFHEYIVEKVTHYIATGVKSRKNNKSLYSKTDVDNAYLTYLKEYVDDGNTTEVVVTDNEKDSISDIQDTDVEKVTASVKVPEFTIDNYKEMYEDYKHFKLPENNPALIGKLFKMLPIILKNVITTTAKSQVNLAPTDDYDNPDYLIVEMCLKAIEMYFPKNEDDFVGCYEKTELDEIIHKTGLIKLFELIKETKTTQKESEDNFVATEDKEPAKEVSNATAKIESKASSIPTRNVSKDSFDLEL